jgi:predicted glycoside hydrolase/deacetylase ChbG (UPF0249 family)
MRSLIIHADDFGLTESINNGILLAMKKGLVTSASLLVNFPSSSKALHLAQQHSLDLGWHLNLTQGRPISSPESVQSLVGSDGEFHSLKVFIAKSFLGQLKPFEIERELLAQLKIILDAKIHPSHLDGHLHVHMFPVVAKVVLKIVQKYKIPFLRIPSEIGGIGVSRFFARNFLRVLKASQKQIWQGANVQTLPFYGISFSGSAGSIESWRNLLQRIHSQTAEIMVHPGFVRLEEFPQLGHLREAREAELNLLQSLELESLIREMGFQLISFRNLLGSS